MTSAQRRVLLFFFRAYWKAYALLSALGLVVAAVEGLHVALLFPVLNEMLGVTPATPGFVGRAVDALLRATPFSNKLVAGCVLLLILTPAKGGLTLIFEWLNGWAAGRVLYRTKKKIIDEYARAPYQFFLDHKLGELQFFALTAPTRAAMILTRMPQILVEALRVVAILGLLWAIDARWTAALVILGVLVQSGIGVLTTKLSYSVGRERVETGTTMNALFNDLIQGIKQIRVFGSQAWWMDRFDVASKLYGDLFTRDAALLASPRTIIETVVLTALVAAILAVQLKRPEQLQALLPIAGTFGVALMKLLPSLAALSRMRIEVMSSLPDLEGIHQSLMVELKRPAEGPKKPFARLEKAIALENVRFDYPSRAGILKGITLAVPAGTTAALVGDSGSGKTTVLNLLLGLYTPTSGKVLLDGVPLDEIDGAAWRSKIGLVSQEAFIFNGTVAENILFGRTFPQDAVERAAKIAHAHGFIGDLPQGYQTQVGERGLKLSGGQQQRLAIARAILGDPQILLLDEATSALDSVSESVVQEAIAEASRGRTVVTIAHRLSTIEAADTIFVLEEGRVVESGSHSELLRLGGRYANFHSLQTSR